MSGKKQHMQRRRFLKGTLATGISLSVAANAAGANDAVQVGVMGTNGRGTALSRAFSKQENTVVRYVCDVDSRATKKASAMAAKFQVYKPREVEDFRTILDDKNIDVLVVAAPNHWHGPATIEACKAGKHVYVEKPCCHNPHEGELMVKAARKYRRVVQMGAQRRSWPKIIEGIRQVREGAIGRAYYSRGVYLNVRGSIGHGKQAEVPSWLNYDLWQGPAPRRPYRSNMIHYNWHWFWHWGNGELGNNGVHSLDLCRWGLGVDHPVRVTSSGGRYHWEDDQQTPDTHVVSYDFPGGKTIVWEGRSCNRNKYGGPEYIASFHGEKGAIILTGTGYAVYDRNDKLVKKESGPGGDDVHVNNFLACIRTGGRPTAEIETGYKSTLLPLLGNIAYRVKRSLSCDPKNGHILKDSEAASFWKREYEPGWEPAV